MYTQIQMTKLQNTLAALLSPEWRRSPSASAGALITPAPFRLQTWPPKRGGAVGGGREVDRVGLGARLLLIAASTIGSKLLISDINNASRQMHAPTLG